MIELEDAAVVYSEIAQTTPLAKLLDIEQAFQSLSHVWMWRMLRAFGVSPVLVALIHGLCEDRSTTFFHNNTTLTLVRSSIKQGCSATQWHLLAIVVGPLVRANLHHNMLTSSNVCVCVCVFAAGVAMVLKDLREQLGAVLVRVEHWRRGIAPALKAQQKCVIIRMAQDHRMWKDLQCVTGVWRCR